MPAPSSTKVDPAGLRALVKLIDQNVEIIIAEYAKQNATVPTLDTIEPGPFDSPEACSTALEDAIHTVEGACGQLSITCSSPGLTMVNKVLSMYQPAAINLVLNGKIADHLGDSKQGMQVSELAKKSGINEGKLARIMRFLASAHLFTEVQQNVFANNRLSAKLRSADATSSLLGHLTDEVMAAASKFSGTFGDPKETHELSPDHSPFYHAFGQNAFQHFGSPEGRFRGERFNRGMLGWGQVTGASGLLSKIYPWGDHAAGTLICDVGGGNGYVMLGLLKDHSHLCAVVQDVPPVLEDAKKLWSAEFPSAIDSQRVSFQTIDFFKESPLKDCPFYYMRHILHDWNDEDSIKILKGIRRVMSPSSKLLIQEFALPFLVRSGSTTIKQAPEPLLPNYGIGKVVPFYADVHMASVLNGKERTIAEFEYLASQSDLKVNKVLNCGEMNLLELFPI